MNQQTKFKKMLANKLTGTVFVVLFAVIGVYLLIGSHAASPTITTSASNGTVGCNASIQSGYVKFGAGNGTSCGGTGGGPGNMWVSLVDGGEVTEAKNAGLKIVRFSDEGNMSTIASFKSNGIKTLILFHGPYTHNGVAALGDPNAWASSHLSEYRQSCDTTQCPAVEILNEPTQGSFWGSNHNDSDPDGKAYAAILTATYKTFHNAYGSSSPLILASYDGGQDASLAWGSNWWSSSVAPYVDGITIHPYGSPSSTMVGSIYGSALGNRFDVTQAHALTGKPVYITEVGWPTGGSTPDSRGWPQTNTGDNKGDQCNNIYNFFEWSKSLGYVGGVFIYGSKDNGTGSYGVADSNGNPKPSFNALKAAAAGQGNPCPGPLTYDPHATWNQ